MINKQSWLENNLHVYFGNASAVKDFRVQLRGNKAVWLWTIYLLLLTLLSMLTYAGVQNHANLSVSEIQFSLKNFYTESMAMLAGAVCLIAPALTAGSIVMEKQRRSLDLLFSAPVSLKGLLVGKMMSSYRYIWMLLVLSIPLTSVAVVMGGATWGDVLQAYVSLSFSGLVLTAIGLLISAISESVAAAIIWTYLATIVYLYATSLLGAPGLISAPGTREAPFFAQLSPFIAALTAPTYTVIFGIHVPNCILGGLASLFICRIFVLGAASSLSSLGGKETASFRLQALLYTSLAIFGLCWAYLRFIRTQEALGILSMLVCGMAFIFLPHIICYTADGGRKYGYSGRPSWVGTFAGARSGSLGYLTALWLAILVGIGVGLMVVVNNPYGGGLLVDPYGAFGSQKLIALLKALGDVAVWMFGFFYMMWGVGRAISSRAKSLKMARAGLVGAIIVFFGLPVPVISLMSFNSMAYADRPYSQPLWAAYLPYPLFSEKIGTAPIYAIVMILIGYAGSRMEKDNAKVPEES